MLRACYYFVVSTFAKFPKTLKCCCYSLTPDEMFIAGYTDDVTSQENHVDAAKVAIEEVIQRWLENPNTELFKQVTI